MREAIEAVVARKPRAELEVELTAADVESFETNGWTSIPRITTDEEVAWLKELYDALFQNRQQTYQGGVWDLVRPYGSAGEDRLPQIVHPERECDALKDTLFWSNGRKLAAQLMSLDPGVLEGWGHMIRKPSRIGDSLPWHQDEAYWDPALIYRALGCWMPLDDATPQNGCMKFIPGSHRQGIVHHRHVDDDPMIPALFVEVDAADEARAVLAPLKAGGAIFHHSRTLHASGPNTSDHVRRAYSTEWQLTPEKAKVAAHRPWRDATLIALNLKKNADAPRS
ncbi:MAG TPA: phytanoyl-CoA dioxygenase family protein [Caulobacteraceae bacterium]|nr:phytanoyl-CoA dioxygenase family protein [Caulobacteraceae bacterium]